MKYKLSQYIQGSLMRDLVSGVTVAALTIPTAMGYAQVAGLPPVYGLYAAILPVVAFALLASSKKVMVGVDATSSAIAGSLLVLAGVSGPEAISFISGFTFFTGVFMLLFALIRLDKFLVYISEPVMSGIISGITLTVLVSQLPKMAGVSLSSRRILGKLIELVGSIGQINWLSLLLAALTVSIIILGKIKLPKIPFSLVTLVVFTILTGELGLDRSGVAIVGQVPAGFPQIDFPHIFQENQLLLILGGALTAFVLGADSLLTSQKFSSQETPPLNERREMSAFGFSNIVSSFSGILPINASVSRTAANKQFRGVTQIVSVISATIITLTLLFFSPLLHFMPESVLAAIVFSALIGVFSSELSYVNQLGRESKREAAIWLMSFLGVIVSGVLLGLTIGVFLSLMLVIVARASSTSAFLGKSEDRGYVDLHRNPEAKVESDVVIYRYSNSLFFLNIGEFITEIEEALAASNSQYLIVESPAIATIDVTAAKKLQQFLRQLKAERIEYYFVNTIGDFRDDIQRRGLTEELPLPTLLPSIEQALIHIKKEK